MVLFRARKNYNKSWDYFKGRTSDEIYNEISNDSRWHRPTWHKIKANFFDFHKINETNNSELNKNLLKKMNILN